MQLKKEQQSKIFFFISYLITLILVIIFAVQKLIFFIYCGGIYNNRVQQFVNFGAPSFLYPRICGDFLLQNRENVINNELQN